MNVLFLDIDGVLNSENFFLNQNRSPFPFLFDRAGDIDPVPCKLLNVFCKEYDIKIVVSSTWRREFDKKQLSELFKRRGLETEVVDITPVLWGKKRGDEVMKYLRDFEHRNRGLTNSIVIQNYVIVDDDDDFYLDQNFVRTDYKVGLNETTIEKLKKHFTPVG